MFYQIDEVLQTVEVTAYDKNILTVGIIPVCELAAMVAKFHFHDHTMKEAMNIHSNQMDYYEDYDFGTLLFNDIAHMREEKTYRAAFYIRRNLLIICSDDIEKVTAVFDSVLTRMPLKNITLEKLIYALFEKTITQDFKIIQTINEQIEAIEEEIMNHHPVAFHQEIAPLRKILLLFQNHYSHLIELTSDLQDNENDVFEEANLRYFHMLRDRIGRLDGQVRLLREYMAQVREAYQAEVDNQLNRIMKVFTVVTTIFLPLTLIVGWYGMNFTNMPELTWQYGYLCVILLSVLVVGFCFYYFKKKKLF